MMSKGQDLSVEEILSSIRGVINNHSTKDERKVPEDAILELTETYVVEDLVSEIVAHEASEVLRDFADHTSKLDPQAFKSVKDKTIEDFVLEILRLEIAKWLNVHLPGIVRQLVEKEIRRLTPKE